MSAKKKILLQGSTNLFRGDLKENHQVNVSVEDAVIVAKAQTWLTAKIAYESTAYKTMTTGKPLPKMFRLWFGYAQNRTDLTSLVQGVNQKLVPATTQCAKGRGLDAYLPALIQSDENQPEIPDEVAVIAYQNADMYDAARLTPPFGPLYGPLHFREGLFAKEVDGFKSGSAVARPFDRATFKVENGLSAYQFNAESVSWQSGVTKLYVLKPQSGSSFERTVADTIGAIESLIEHGTLDASLVALDKDHEAVLVWAHGRQKSSIDFSQDLVQVKKVITYHAQKEGGVKFGLDEGVSVSFDARLLTSDKLFQPILDSSANAQEW